MFILPYASRMHLIQGQGTTRIFSYWHSPSLSSLFLWLCDHHHMHNACQNSTNAFSTMKIATQWSQSFFFIQTENCQILPISNGI